MHINRDGYADNAAVVYRVSNKVVKEMAAALNSDCTVKGVVLKTDPSGGRILVDSEREIGLKIGSISVLVWDDEAQKVSVGSVSDINIGDYVIADIDNTDVMLRANCEKVTRKMQKSRKRILQRPRLLIFLKY